MKSVYAEYCKIMEFLLKSTPAPQQPCPYRLTSGLKRQYTLLNVPPASPTRLTACAVNYISFITLWHRYCSKIKIQPARSDLCDKCDQMLVSLQHSLSNEKRTEKNDKYNQHLIKAKAFRDSYNTNIEDAEKEWGRKDQILGCLDSRIQLSPFTSHAYMQMQYSFDYCQQVSLTYSSQQRGTFYFRIPHKVQVFGVCCEPLSRQVFFLIDEAEQIAVVASVIRCWSRCNTAFPTRSVKRKMTSTTNTSSRPKHSAIATIQILRMLRRNGEGRDRRIVTRSWVA